MKYLLILFLFTSSCIFGQTITNEVISSNGNHFKNSSAEISWTVGDIVTETHSNSSVTLTQGFHQVTIIEDTSNPGGFNSNKNIEFNVYPNPTFKNITITTVSTLGELNAKVYDSKGSLSKEKKIENGNGTIEVSELSEGIYYLKIFDDKNQFIKSYKIEKFNK